MSESVITPELTDKGIYIKKGGPPIQPGDQAVLNGETVTLKGPPRESRHKGFLIRAWSAQLASGRWAGVSEIMKDLQ